MNDDAFYDPNKPTLGGRILHLFRVRNLVWRPDFALLEVALLAPAASSANEVTHSETVLKTEPET